MVKVGLPPYLECSSKGDKRFSAFYARIKGRGNKSIEEIYQAAKVFDDGSTGLSWRDAKGRKPVNAFYVSLLYKRLWKEYLRENPEYITIIKSATGLSDIFGQEGHNCQATALWGLRNEF